MRAFSNWRAYRKLPAEWRGIVFYSESGQDWHYFEALIEELNGPLDRKVTYVTSDAADPGLSREHPNFRALCIPEGWFLTLHFQFQKAGVVVLTMMDLDTLQLKRSINGVYYIYLFHSMGSTHMVDHANSYDAYDSLFCVGPHHVRELRRPSWPRLRRGDAHRQEREALRELYLAHVRAGWERERRPRPGSSEHQP